MKLSALVDYNSQSLLLKLSVQPVEDDPHEHRTDLLSRSYQCAYYALLLLLRIGKIRYLLLAFGKLCWRAFSFLPAFLLGFVLLFVILDAHWVHYQEDHHSYALNITNESVDNRSFQVLDIHRAGHRKWLYVGILSANRYLNNRAMNCYQTWAKEAPIFEVFIGKEDIVDHPDQLPVVALPGKLHFP